MKQWLADVFLQRSRQARYQEILARDPLYYGGFPYGYIWYRLREINQPVTRWKRCLFSVEHDGLHLYPWTQRMDSYHFFPHHSFRWFGRPSKYKYGRNELWLHLEINSRWMLLSIEAERSPMQRMIRALKEIATPEQNTAYRRRRPYIHLGPINGYAAEQDLYGVWSLEPDPALLYLMPSAFVVMQADGRIQHTLPLEQIQNIEAMQRMDVQPSHNHHNGRGIVRFRYQGAVYAYKVPDYVTFAESLAEAAKRTLEDPPVFYNKKKYDDEDE